MEITIREGKETESQQLSDIARVSKKHWNYPDAWIEIWSETLKITPEFITNNNVWVAESGKNILGFVAISIKEDVAEIEHLWVLPNYLRNGIGKGLFIKVIEYCQLNKVKTLRIESDPNAQGFYEKMGARQVGYVDSIPKPRNLPVLTMDIKAKY